jgi:hypothetical protein
MFRFSVTWFVFNLQRREYIFRPVREYEGWVRNVTLIKCILDPGKPKRGWNSGEEGTGARWGTRGVSLQATWD